MTNKAVLSARMLEATRQVRERVALAVAAENTPAEKRLPLVLDALEAAVAAMDAMTDRMMADAVASTKEPTGGVS